MKSSSSRRTHGLHALRGACLPGILFAVLIAMAATSGAAADKPPQDQGWPREFNRNGAKLIVYQPQIDQWERFRVLTADTAVSLTTPGQKPALGVISWQANTVPDLANRTVAINDIHVVSARFPSLDAAAAATAQNKLMQIYPQSGMVISMDRMLAGFRAEKAAPATALNIDPPPIYVSMSPAILLFVDGDPIRVPIQGTKISYIVNTTWNLFYEDRNYYLLVNTTWLTSTDLTGPWKPTTKLPSDMSKVPSANNWQEVKKALPAKAGTGPVPQVFYSTKPAELLVFKGEPAFAAIPPTSLNYATNTTS